MLGTSQFGTAFASLPYRGRSKRKAADVESVRKYLVKNLNAKNIEPRTADVDKVKACVRVVNDYGRLVGSQVGGGCGPRPRWRLTRRWSPKAAARKAAALNRSRQQEHGGRGSGWVVSE